MSAPRAQLVVHALGLALLGVVAWLAWDLRLARAPGMMVDDAARAALPTPLVPLVTPTGAELDHRDLVPDHLVDDPDGAYHLRRVQVALAAGEVPDVDRFLNHPAGGSAVPWPPLFDGLLAYATRLAQGRPGQLGITPAYEAALEARAVRLPPLLGALTTVAVALAAGALLQRGRPGLYVRRGFVLAPTVGSLLAATAYATLPIAAWYGDVGRVDHHVAIALLLALHHLAFARIFACGAFESDASGSEVRGLDATFGGITGGFVAGLALLVWLASAVFVVLAGVTFWLAAAGRLPERAEDARRAGALYFLTAALVTLPAALASPWNALQPNSVINLTTGVPLVLGAAAVALWVPGLLAVVAGERGPLASGVDRTAGGRALGLAATPVVGLALTLALPGFLTGLREGLAWANRSNLFMDVVDESRPLVEVGAGSLVRGVATDLGQVGLALPLVALGLVLVVRRSMDRDRGRLRPEARFHLLLNLVVFALLALGQRRFGNSLAVPLAIAAGVVPGLALGRLEEGRTGGWWRRGTVGLGLALGVLVLVAGLVQGRALARPHGPTLADTRAWRAELLAGLRWMRGGTPASGPWTLAESEQGYGVLSAWWLGHLIEYHARRPVVATNFGSFVGPEAFPASARALLERDPAAALARLDALGADYVVVTPRVVGDLASQARIAELPPARRQALFTRVDGRKTFSAAARETLAWRLGVTPQDGVAPEVPGLERVYASGRRESIFGGAKAGPAGPVISIWRRVE